VIGRSSVTNLLAELRAEGEISAHDETQAEPLLAGTPPGTPWYARVLAGASAWMSAAFILCSLSCFEFEFESLFIGLGCVALVASIVFRRVIESARDGRAVWDFGIQCALIGTLVGRGLLFLGLNESLGDEAVALLMCGIEIAIIASYPDRLQGFGATIFALGWMWVWLDEMGIRAPVIPIVAAGLGAGLVWMRRSLRRDRFDRELMRPVGFAALAFALATGTVEASDDLVASVSIVAIAVWLVAAVAVEQVRRASAGLRIAIGLLAVVLLGGLTVSSPGLVFAVALGILGFHRRDVLLFGCATVAVAITLTHFYYDLDFGLSAKGFLLIGTGVALWLLSFVPKVMVSQMEVKL